MGPSRAHGSHNFDLESHLADEPVMAVANAEMGAKYVSLSTVESDPSLAQAERKVGRTWEQLSGMGGAQVGLAD